MSGRMDYGILAVMKLLWKKSRRNLKGETAVATQVKGKCKYCGKEYTRSYIMRHLASCKARKERDEGQQGRKKCGYFDLLVSGKYNRDMWLAIEVTENAPLQVVDTFLRNIWLECCGHLSAFEIDGTSYESHPDLDDFWGPRAESMDCRLKNVLEKGMVFRYEYDFGSTTELVIQVANYRKAPEKRDVLTLLSRNEAKEYICWRCGKRPAVYVDTNEVDPWGYHGKEAFVCEKCADKYYGDDFYFSNVCNSPRMGICGYEGSRFYPDQFVPDVSVPAGDQSKTPSGRK